MAIPAKNIVEVTSRIISAAGSDLEFNGLLLSTSTDIPGLVVAFSSASDVGDYFGYTSEEYQAATTYFLGYTNSFAKPRALYIARLVTEDSAAFIRGSDFSTTAAYTIAALNEITDGDLTLMLGTSTLTVSGVDFSSATTLSGIAEILQTSINAMTDGGDAWTAATVTYSSQFDAFVITAGTTGEESGVSYATGTIAEAMNLTEDAGAVICQGMAAMETAENMDAIVEETANWVCFTTVEEADETLALELANWANDQGIAYLYVYWTTNVNVPVAATLTEANVGATCGVYGHVGYAAMILGTAASIDWDRRNGTITFAFKQNDGLSAAVVDSSTANALEAATMNYVGNWATRNDEFIFLYPGCMFGDWEWIDTYLNAIWLNSALQTAIMSGFVQTPRVPYNDRGYTLIRAWCMDPINRALYNGVIDTGVALSESQKSELYLEAGRDISTELNTDGYVLSIGYDSEDDSDDSTEASVRASRESPEASLWFTYGGSVHRLTIASTTVA